MNYLILKLRQRYKATYRSDCDWSKLITGGWRVNPNRLVNVDTALIIYQKHIVASYHIGEDITFNRNDNRCYLLLTPSNNHKYVGKAIDYRTNNPATIADDNKIQKLITLTKEEAKNK